MAAIMEPASNSFQTVPYWPIASDISTCTTRSSLVGAISSGQKKEFHWLMNINRPGGDEYRLGYGQDYADQNAQPGCPVDAGGVNELQWDFGEKLTE